MLLLICYARGCCTNRLENRGWAVGEIVEQGRTAAPPICLRRWPRLPPAALCTRRRSTPHRCCSTLPGAGHAHAFKMEIIHVIILLLATHAAVGIAKERPKDEDPCQSADFAREINLFCVNRVSPTSICCESVIASVDIEGSGTAPCLCRVAAEPMLVMAGLKTTDLLAIFALCRALVLGGAPLEAACEGVDSPEPPTTELITHLHQQHYEATTSQNSTAIGTGSQQPERKSTLEALQGDTVVTPCNAPRLAFELNRFCSSWVITGRCCKAVMSSIDIDNSAETPCLCLVIDQWTFLSSGLGLDDILYFYDECTGRQGIHQFFDDLC